MDYTQRLPIEVLCNTFRFVQLVHGVPTAADIAATKLDARNNALFRLGWLSLTHVCARWRTAALNDRSLWTDVPATIGTNWLYKFFWRSGRRAVSVDWQSAHAPAYAPVLNALNTIFVPLVHWRLRNFQTCIKEGDALFGVLLRPWPALVEADVVLVGEFPTHALLANTAPRLASLKFQTQSSINGCSAFPLRAPFVRALVVFDATFEDGISEELMGELLDVLGGMRALRHLRLADARVYGHMYHAPPEPCASPNRVQELALESLAIAGDWFTIKHVMKHIFPPPAVRVSLALRVRPNQVRKTLLKENLPAVFARIREWRGAQPCAPGGYCALEAAFSIERFYSQRHRPLQHVVRVRAGRCPAASAPPHTGGGAAVVRAFEISFPNPCRGKVAPFVASVLAAVARHNEAGQARSLAVRCAGGALLPEGFVGSLTGVAFRGVEVLRVAAPRPGLDFLGPLAAAVDDVKNHKGRVGKVKLFPALRVLDLDGCALWELAQHNCARVLHRLVVLRRRWPANSELRVYPRAVEELARESRDLACGGMASAPPAPDAALGSTAIIDALGTTFKDANGAPLPNERIAQMLLDNMHELAKLAKEGKISVVQIQQLQEFADKHAQRTAAPPRDCEGDRTVRTEFDCL